MPKRRLSRQPQSAATKRQRVYAACSECKRRRRKCDGQQPCSSCFDYGYTCTYAARSISPDASAVQSHGVNQSGRHRGASNARDPELLSNEPRQLPPAQDQVSTGGKRMINTRSAVALPHVVGRDLGTQEPPRLHSFAWNLGIRPETRGSVGYTLSTLITNSECCEFSRVYFRSVHVMLPFLSEDAYFSLVQRCWNRLHETPNIEALIAGVVALGSFFSSQPHPLEERIKQHCFSILDFALSTPSAMVDIDSVSAWILRALYIRSTTRPACGCLAIHTAVHMAEIVSLRHSLVADTSGKPPVETSPMIAESIAARQRQNCIAWTLDVLLSAEYGLAPVVTACSKLVEIDNDKTYLHHVLTLGKIVYAAGDASCHGTASLDMDLHCSQLESIPNDQAIMCLFKADVCLSLLRSFASTKTHPQSVVTYRIVAILRDGLEHGDKLLKDQQPWWNLLSVPFQTILVCLAFDSPPYLALLPTAMELLRAIAETFKTHMAQEALHTAQTLLTTSRDRTNEGLIAKDAALAYVPPAANTDWPSLDQSNFDFLDGWPLDLDFLQ